MLFRNSGHSADNLRAIMNDVVTCKSSILGVVCLSNLFVDAATVLDQILQFLH